VVLKFHLQDQPPFLTNVSPGLHGVTVQTIAGCCPRLYIFRNSRTDIKKFKHFILAETWERGSGLGEGQRNFDFMN
jgi:hypothetical protein